MPRARPRLLPRLTARDEPVAAPDGPPRPRLWPRWRWTAAYLSGHAGPIHWQPVQDIIHRTTEVHIYRCCQAPELLIYITIYGSRKPLRKVYRLGRDFSTEAVQELADEMNRRKVRLRLVKRGW